jgi:hypothetical protein
MRLPRLKRYRVNRRPTFRFFVFWVDDGDDPASIPRWLGARGIWCRSVVQREEAYTRRNRAVTIGTLRARALDPSFVPDLAL